MRTIPTILAILAASFALMPTDLTAQKFPPLDKSPVDISYLRVNKQALAKVTYGRPQKNGREIFGNLVPYGKIWRTGANECTEIKFFKDVMLGGQELTAGAYALFTIPGEEKWTIIINKGIDQWGAFGYDSAEDAIRLEVPVSRMPESVEAFTIAFADTENGGTNLVLAWDMTKVEVPVAAK